MGRRDLTFFDFIPGPMPKPLLYVQGIRWLVYEATRPENLVAAANAVHTTLFPRSYRRTLQRQYVRDMQDVDLDACAAGNAGAKCHREVEASPLTRLLIRKLPVVDRPESTEDESQELPVAALRVRAVARQDHTWTGE